MRGISILAIAIACLTIGFAAAVIVGFHGSEQWPEFFGALTTSLVAAAALIFGAYYQDKLSGRRQAELHSREKIAETIDLCFWLQHCEAELKFIRGALQRAEDLALEKKMPVEISSNQFRDIISSHFYGELLERAKSASKLPPEISGMVAKNLYTTFTTVDRLFSLRAGTKNYSPSTTEIQQYIFVLDRRQEVMRESVALIEAYLISIRALPDFERLDDD